MSEQLNGGDEAMWAALEASLMSDAEFAEQITDVNDALDIADLSAPLELHGVMSDPYWLEDISDVGESLHETFMSACQEAGVDTNAATHSGDDYLQVSHEVLYACYALKNRLFANDVVQSDRGIYTEVRADGAEAFVLEPGEKLVGHFTAPIVGMLPDEAYFLTRDKTRPIPACVGLRLESPVILKETGEVEERFAPDTIVVITLGTVGLQLKKFHFASDLSD